MDVLAGHQHYEVERDQGLEWAKSWLEMKVKDDANRERIGRPSSAPSNIKYSDDGYQPASPVTLGAAGFDDQERMVTALSSSNENELFSKSKIKKLNHMKSKYQIVNNVMIIM